MAAYTGFTTSSHLDAYYNRIWLLPEALDFTGIPIGTPLSFSIWNAYTVGKTFNTYFPSAELSAISFVLQTALPYNALKLIGYTATNTSANPNFFTGTTLFDFTDAEDVTLTIQGQAFESFIYNKNWTTNISEYYSYLTDIKTFTSGKEQRIRRRKNPRRGLSFKINPVDSGNEKDAARLGKTIENHLTFIYGKKTLVPEWQDQVFLTANLPLNSASVSGDFSNKDYQVGNYIVIFNNPYDYDILKLSTVSTSTLGFSTNTPRAKAAGSRIAPLRSSIFGEDSVSNTKEAGFLMDIEPKFSILAESLDTSLRNVTFTPDSTYRGKDVVVLDNNFTESQNIQYTQQSRILDFEHTIFSPDRSWLKDKQITSFNVQLQNRSQFTKFLSFFNRVCGNWKSFWLINKKCELELTDTVADTSTGIWIKDVGITKFRPPLSIPLHIYAIDYSNNIYVRQVITSSYDTNQREFLLLNESFGITTTPTTFKAFGFLNLVRLLNDDLEINWETDSIATTTLSCIEVFDDL